MQLTKATKGGQHTGCPLMWKIPRNRRIRDRSGKC